MSAAGILAGESRDQYVSRLESELIVANDRIEELEAEVESGELQDDADSDASSELEFLRAQLTELSQQIASPSAPSAKGEMRRALEGMLRGEDWRNRTWRRQRKCQ